MPRSRKRPGVSATLRCPQTSFGGQCAGLTAARAQRPASNARLLGVANQMPWHSAGAALSAVVFTSARPGHGSTDLLPPSLGGCIEIEVEGFMHGPGKVNSAGETQRVRRGSARMAHVVRKTSIPRFEFGLRFQTRLGLRDHAPDRMSREVGRTAQWGPAGAQPPCRSSDRPGIDRLDLSWRVALRAHEGHQGTSWCCSRSWRVRRPGSP